MSAKVIFCGRLAIVARLPPQPAVRSRVLPCIHRMCFLMRAQNTVTTLESKYRPDIDGLRALAVGIIVLFHLGIGGFESGYAGVDIFFVISGYLIIGHICRDIAAQRFSFAEFYARRARRILPALVAVTGLSFAVGWLWLPPEFLRQFAKEATHGLLSISNIQYWREAKQYFAPSSEQLGLLHLWSLSLEEQFYLFCPLVIVLLSRIKRVFSGIAVIGLVSALAAFFWHARDPEAVFFLTPFRVFEFGIDALAIPLERRISGSPAARICGVCVGYMILACSLLILGRFQQYGGLGALPVCFATSAIIASYISAWILTNGAALAVGRSSYSLYLVHWPVVFFARFIFGESAETSIGIVAQLAAMAALTAAIFLAIEQPLRRIRPVRWKLAVGFAVTILAGVVITNATFRADGAVGRLGPEQFARTRLQEFGMSPCVRVGYANCAFGDLNGRPSLELIGDSYVQQYAAALNDPLIERGIRGFTSTVGGCLMLFGLVQAGPRSKDCSDLRTTNWTE